MAYVSEWERLSDARRRVMTAARLSKDEAQTDICQAIADGAIKIRGKLRSHTTKPMVSSMVFEGTAFSIPTDIKSKDLDWEGSRPVKPWIVRRGAFSPSGFWTLEWIELFATDVTNALCTARKQGEPAEPEAAGPPRRRGARPKKFERVRDAMRSDIQEGRRTVAELKTMLEKNLAEAYAVSRDTARKARKAVLPEFGES